ncbi:MAG: putative bifunctional diguanylate cyclase/phosphodiesterase [Roseobacter sp.]
MQSMEELRDILAAQQKENHRLRARASEADLLMTAMQELFAMGHPDDPFTVVFSALEKMLSFDGCLALTEVDRRLVCESATDSAFCGANFDVADMERKALRGKAIALLPCSRTCIDPIKQRAALYLPLSAAGSRGVLVVYRDKQHGVYSKMDLKMASRFAILANQALALRAQSEVQTHNKYLTELSKTLEQQAHYDQLTQLPNRTKIEMVLDEMVARGTDAPFALAFVDVNKFKQINDYYGHDVGDKLLQTLSRRISDLIRPRDVLSRISGDEFLIVIDGASSHMMIDMFMDRIVDAVGVPCQIDQFLVHCSISAGIACFPKDSTNQFELRRHADSAMYRAKTIPGGSIVHFDTSMAQDVTAKMEVESRLRRAIEACSFTPVFQPQVNIRDQSVSGLEVLLRWQDEDGRLHAPAAFLHIAEELGLINQITEITAHKVAQSMPALIGCFGEDLTVSINIAAGQATNIEFLERLIDVLEPSRHPGRFFFEITEDQELDVVQFTSSVRPLLDENCVKIAIDDFGKGYSSLSALSEINAHEVKVDRDFISDIHLDPAKQRVLQMIEYYAAASGIKCVVEGAETQEEISFLIDHTHTTLVQGYYYGKPMEVHDLLSWSPSFQVRKTA